MAGVRAAPYTSRMKKVDYFETWDSFVVGGYTGSALNSNTRSAALDQNIVEELKVWPPCIPFEYLASTFEVEETIKSMLNRKAVGPDELPVELLKIIFDEDLSPPYTGAVRCHYDRHMARRGCTAGLEICHDHCTA